MAAAGRRQSAYCDPLCQGGRFKEWGQRRRQVESIHSFLECVQIGSFTYQEGEDVKLSTLLISLQAKIAWIAGLIDGMQGCRSPLDGLLFGLQADRDEGMEP